MTHKWMMVILIEKNKIPRCEEYVFNWFKSRGP